MNADFLKVAASIVLGVIVGVAVVQWIGNAPTAALLVDKPSFCKNVTSPSKGNQIGWIGFRLVGNPLKKEAAAAPRNDCSAVGDSVVTWIVDPAMPSAKYRFVNRTGNTWPVCNDDTPVGNTLDPEAKAEDDFVNVGNLLLPLSLKVGANDSLTPRTEYGICFQVDSVWVPYPAIIIKR